MPKSRKRQRRKVKANPTQRRRAAGSIEPIRGRCTELARLCRQAA